ncbi:LysR family transcriptional regulator [Burkholderia sp. Bp9031]|uniref:LysR family transcriptional regulator n=1 Tax=Burkholderia sp. Bp9031 TaxID=2184566 RepID=UPI000F5E9B64|nr:LysR family transcriptional regulator [Burkholderia sp. Bp9031]RQZ21006.1 LysR family transcriptional regulator [Burkholderia sp. Bp9031]
MDTLQCMRIFARVAIEGGFASTARKLNLATPVISRAVSHLESHLGTRLLNRTTRNVVLTEAGERYLRRCRAILASIDEAETEAGSAMQRPSGRLRVHALSSFGHHLVVPAVLKYQQQFPLLSVELTLSSAVPNVLEEGYDASIVLAPELPDSGLVSVLLGSISGIICASPDYLAAHGEPGQPCELNAHQCLQLTTPVFPVDKWVFAGTGTPYAVDIGAARFAVNVVEALEPAVRSGLGIAILPWAVALPGLASGALVRVMRDYEVQPVNVYALYPSRQFLDAKIRAWIEFLREDLPTRFDADKRALANLYDA